MDILFLIVQQVASELALFAGIGFALFAMDEMLVDLLWLGRAAWRRFFIFAARRPATAETLAPSNKPGKIAIFIPAWDESAVIGEMLGWTARAYADQDHDIFVGCYPNDPETVAIVEGLGHKTMRAIVCTAPGPTTKADCLNHLWRAMRRAEAEEWEAYKGVVLHDAEDMVSPQELQIFAALLDRFDLIQLPVVPMVDQSSRLISGHYCDEFAEAHGKTLIVREMLGAAVPSAGVGCALRYEMLEKLAQVNGGLPFKIDSLTEDYELGLHIREMGGRTVFVRLPGGARAEIAGTHAHFPATIEAAVRQKARWMVGISLAGWDRLGWRGGWGELWMRWRDRRAILAAVLIVAGYLALAGFLGLMILCWLVPSQKIEVSPFLEALLAFNAIMLVWRVMARAFFVRRIYGWGEAALSIVRMPVANVIAVMAARRAIWRYWQMLGSGEVVWDKTDHKFPVIDEQAK